MSWNINEFKLNEPIFKSICLLMLLCLLFTGCDKSTREPFTADNLAGKRIGVIIGYSTDYILSASDYNLNIFRYDTYADMQMALGFNRIDAIAMEKDEANVLCRMKPDYEVALVIEEELEYAYMFNADRQELLEQFNQFIGEFKQTTEYANLIKRVEAAAYAPFQAQKVENTAATDRVLKVAAFDGWEPVSYINASTGEWEGGDVELITHFSNSIGAKLELIDMSWEQMLIEIGIGSVDLLLCPDSVLMAKDLEMSGNIIMSDWVFLKDIVLVVNKEKHDG